MAGDRTEPRLPDQGGCGSHRADEGPWDEPVRPARTGRVRLAMKALPTFSRRARWAVPTGAVALAAAVTAGSMISSAQASPELPLRTPAQLLASVAGRTAPLPALRSEEH